MAIEAVKLKDASMYQGSTGAQTLERAVAVKAQAEPENYAVGSKRENFKTDDNGGKAAKGPNAKNENGSANSEQLKSAVSDLNKKMNNSEAVFGIHEDTNRVMIKIVDKDSKKVLKEYPAEETLDMIAKAWELAGLMVDEKR